MRMCQCPNPNDRYRTVDVPVRGGTLRVGLWEPGRTPPMRDIADAPTILAIHGVTASHRCWDMLAAALPGYRLIAPDLRGRGRSNALPGPYGMAQHADDMADVLDFLGVPQALVVGHSMGGFVSVMFAHRHAGRVASLLLVDGGMPLRMPEGMTTDSLIAALGPAADRLSMTFPDHEAYRNFWRVHPAFVDSWNEAVTDYIDYDLVGIPPELHPATLDRGDDRGHPRAVRHRPHAGGGRAAAGADHLPARAPRLLQRSARTLLTGMDPALAAAAAGAGRQAGRGRQPLHHRLHRSRRRGRERCCAGVASARRPAALTCRDAVSSSPPR